MSTETATVVAKKCTLRSVEGESFEVDQDVAQVCQTIKNLIEDGFADTVIPIPNVTSITLAKVIEYCKKHVDDPNPDDFTRYDEDYLKKWDEDFVNVDQPLLFDLILAAHYLDIKGLLDLTCKTVADMMKGKSPKEIRKLFHIVNDYTREEEAEVRRENRWAFESLNTEDK